MVNAAVIAAARSDHNAAVEAKERARIDAEKTYWAILKDPKRTSDQDKAALQNALQVLGKTIHDAAKDAQLLQTAQDLAKGAEDRHVAAKEEADAAAALKHFHEVEKLEMQKKITELLHQRMEAHQQAIQRLNAAKISLYDLRVLRVKNPHLADHLPEDAAGEPLIYLNGSLHDPHGVAPQRDFRTSPARNA